MAGSGNSVRVVLAALAANALIAVAKFIAFAFTRSTAMLAEAFHSVADCGNQVLMLVGLKRADKPPDRDHPYGYGKEPYFWSFVVAISIFTLGATIALYEGIHKLIEIAHGSAAAPRDQTVGLIVLGVSILIEGSSLLVALREFRRTHPGRRWGQVMRETRQASLITVLFEDAAAVGGLALALVGVGLSAVTGQPLYDALASVLIGILLVVVAFFLGWMTKKLLIGQSAPVEVEERIRGAIDQSVAVEQIVELKTLHMGENYILLNLGIEFRDDMNTTGLELAIDDIEARVKSAVPEVRRIFIEADSLRPGRPKAA